MRIAFSALIISLAFFASGQVQLSDQAKVSVVTLGPYQGEVWSAFGHNGFRIEDPANGIDWLYDYGVYDFDQENFFLNFAKGLLKYKVAVRDWNRSFRYHKSINRYVKIQYLNVSQADKQALFDYLQHNAKPENSEYLYNYVFDNCATKMRDVLKEIYPDRITFDLSYKQDEKTIRDLMEDFLAEQYWGDLGIDIGLGQQIDREATAEEYMFLPPYIFKALAGATFQNDSLTVPLVSETIHAFTPIEEEQKEAVFFTPFNFFVLLFFIVGLITHRNLKSGRRSNWLDMLLFSVVGFAGWWVAYLWVGTEHLSKWNLNILWAIPFHLPLVFFIGREKMRNFFRRYFQVVGIIYSLLLLSWAVLPQPLHQALVPFILALILRSVYLSFVLKKKPM